MFFNKFSLICILSKEFPNLILYAMKIQHINVIYYSPTGTSCRIARKVVEGLKNASRELCYCTTTEYNLTLQNYLSDVTVSDSINIVTSPVYGGRIPDVVVKRLEKIRSMNSIAVPITVYGNRDYDDALLELADILEAKGFRIAAAAAFIGEQSYSRKEMPVAQGRPDMKDCIKAVKFGQELVSKISDTENWHKLTIKGHRPYREKSPGNKQAPVWIKDRCTGCRLCTSVCPVGAISMKEDGTVIADGNICTKCCACVKKCPAEALIFNTPATEKLFKNFSARKEPEIFI